MTVDIITDKQLGIMTKKNLIEIIKELRRNVWKLENDIQTAKDSAYHAQKELNVQGARNRKAEIMLDALMISNTGLDCIQRISEHDEDEMEVECYGDQALIAYTYRLLKGEV